MNRKLDIHELHISNSAESSLHIHRNAKLYTMMILFMLITVFSVSIGLSSLINSTTIMNTVEISILYAKTGLAADIQSTVNTAASAGGGTVVVPAGTWVWDNPTPTTNNPSNTACYVVIPTGVNVIGTGLAGCNGHSTWTNYTAQTIIELSSPLAPSYDTFFYVNGQSSSTHNSNGKQTRISGIEFMAPAPANSTVEGQEGGFAIFLEMCSNWRVDHCTFINFCQIAVFSDANSGAITNAYAYGVIDHCVCTNPYKLNTDPIGTGWAWGYGFYSRGDMKPSNDNWDNNTLDFLGEYGSIAACSLMYVEDCHFSYCRHSTDGLQGCWNVIRFNLFDNDVPGIGDICLHGSQSWYSGKGEEVYNNTVYGDALQQDLGGVRLRGGSAFIFNNTIIYAHNLAYQTAVCLDNYDYSTLYPFTNINQTYVWSNVNINCTAIRVLQGTLNVNYFLRAPNQSQDGFTYTPYPYPNPSTVG